MLRSSPTANFGCKIIYNIQFASKIHEVHTATDL